MLTFSRRLAWNQQFLACDLILPKFLTKLANPPIYSSNSIHSLKMTLIGNSEISDLNSTFIEIAGSALYLTLSGPEFITFSPFFVVWPLNPVFFVLLRYYIQLYTALYTHLWDISIFAKSLSTFCENYSCLTSRIFHSKYYSQIVTSMRQVGMTWGRHEVFQPDKIIGFVQSVSREGVCCNFGCPKLLALLE